MDKTSFPNSTAYRPAIIDPELKRMIEARERPFHHDLIHVADCLADFENMGISFTQITLAQSLKRLGHERLPRMQLNGSLTCLWAIRDHGDYRRMASTWLRKHYNLRVGIKQPKLGARFDPEAAA